MKFVADIDIPFLKGVFEPYAEVVYAKGREIDARMVRDADALIIRTRTRCDASLLEGSRVRLIASATIGTDHVDLAYCRRKGIRFLNAAGCNAGGVMQYIYTALYGLSLRDRRFRLGPETVIGVVGVGHVGTLVAGLGEYLGFRVLRNDPPKEERQRMLAGGNDPERTGKEGEIRYCPIDELLLRSDVVTLHVPLDEKTYRMAGGSFFGRMKPGAVFMNASRGEVVDEAALLAHRDRMSGLVLDVWDHEPDIDRKLLDAADIATPHIAGYSYEGKVNGTTMVVRGAAEFFRIPELARFTVIPPEPNRNLLDLKGKNTDEISGILNDIFPIFEDDRSLREHPEEFERIRSNYKYRREFYVDAIRTESVEAERDFC